MTVPIIEDRLPEKYAGIDESRGAPEERNRGMSYEPMPPDDAPASCYQYNPYAARNTN